MSDEKRRPGKKPLKGSTKFFHRPTDTRDQHEHRQNKRLCQSFKVIATHLHTQTESVCVRRSRPRTPACVCA